MVTTRSPIPGHLCTVTQHLTHLSGDDPVPNSRSQTGSPSSLSRNISPIPVVTTRSPIPGHLCLSHNISPTSVVTTRSQIQGHRPGHPVYCLSPASVVTTRSPIPGHLCTVTQHLIHFSGDDPVPNSRSQTGSPNSLSRNISPIPVVTTRSPIPGHLCLSHNISPTSVVTTRSQIQGHRPGHLVHCLSPTPVVTTPSPIPGHLCTVREHRTHLSGDDPIIYSLSQTRSPIHIHCHRPGHLFIFTVTDPVT